MVRTTGQNLSSAARAKDDRGFQFWIALLLGISFFPILFVRLLSPAFPAVHATRAELSKAILGQTAASPEAASSLYI